MIGDLLVIFGRIFWSIIGISCIAIAGALFLQPDNYVLQDVPIKTYLSAILLLQLVQTAILSFGQARS